MGGGVPLGGMRSRSLTGCELEAGSRNLLKSARFHRAKTIDAEPEFMTHQTIPGVRYGRPKLASASRLYTSEIWNFRVQSSLEHLSSCFFLFADHQKCALPTLASPTTDFGYLEVLDADGQSRNMPARGPAKSFVVDVVDALQNQPTTEP